MARANFCEGRDHGVVLVQIARSAGGIVLAAIQTWPGRFARSARITGEPGAGWRAPRNRT